MLAWKLSNTMEADFCIEALQDALARFGAPEIFNTDQGSQFTCPRFTQVLKDAKVRISMDGRGRWMDNVFIERLWRSLKYECVYIRLWLGARPTRRIIKSRRHHLWGMPRRWCRSVHWRHDHQHVDSLNKPPDCPNGRGHLGLEKQIQSA